MHVRLIGKNKSYITDDNKNLFLKRLVIEGWDTLIVTPLFKGSSDVPAAWSYQWIGDFSQHAVFETAFDLINAVTNIFPEDHRYGHAVKKFVSQYVEVYDVE